MSNSGPNGEWVTDNWKPALPVIGFKVWYSNGTLNSEDTPWVKLKRGGVQCIKFFHPEGRSTFTDGWDEYTHPDFPEGRHNYRTLNGEEIDYDKYEEILKVARSDQWRPKE